MRLFRASVSLWDLYYEFARKQNLFLSEFLLLSILSSKCGYSKRKIQKTLSGSVSTPKCTPTKIHLPQVSRTPEQWTNIRYAWRIPPNFVGEIDCDAWRGRYLRKSFYRVCTFVWGRDDLLSQVNKNSRGAYKHGNLLQIVGALYVYKYQSLHYGLLMAPRIILLHCSRLFSFLCVFCGTVSAVISRENFTNHFQTASLRKEVNRNGGYASFPHVGFHVGFVLVCT